MAGRAKPHPEREKLIVAEAKKAAAEGPFSTIELRARLTREFPVFRQISQDTLRLYIAYSLTDAGFFKVRNGRSSVWSLNELEQDKGRWVHKDPDSVARSRTAKNLIGTLYHGFRDKEFTITQAANLIHDTSDYTITTAKRYAQLIIGAARKTDIDTGVRKLRVVQKGRKPVTSEILWELQCV